MRYVIPFVLFIVAAFSSCTSLARFGDAVCDAQQDISATVDEALGWAGVPGKLIANITNTVLKVGCKVFSVVANAPQDAAADIGLAERQSDAQSDDDAATSQPHDPSR